MHSPFPHEPLGRSFFCKRANCGARFLTFGELIQHQHQHGLEEDRKVVVVEQGPMNIEWRGTVARPPPVVTAAFKRCKDHKFALPGKCAMCEQVYRTIQPQGPCLWYRRVKFSISLEESSIPCIFDIADKEDPPISAIVAWPKPDGSKGAGRYPFYVVAMCTDETGRAWLAGRIFYDLFSVQHMVDEEDLPSNFDSKIERIEDSDISFVPLVAVVGWCLIVRCTLGAYGRFLSKPRAAAASATFLSRLRLARHQTLTSELDRNTESRGGSIESRENKEKHRVSRRAKTPTVIMQI